MIALWWWTDFIFLDQSQLISSDYAATDLEKVGMGMTEKVISLKPCVELLFTNVFMSLIWL